VSRRDIQRATDAELAAVARDSTQAGWTPDLAARALRAMRLAAAAGLGQDVAARAVGDGTATRGLVVTRGILKQERLEVSSPVTAADIRRVLSTQPAVAAAARRDALEDLARSLSTFSSVVYRQTFNADGQLDDALATARTAAERLAAR
jgi:hypothetical protein